MPAAKKTAPVATGAVVKRADTHNSVRLTITMPDKSSLTMSSSFSGSRASGRGATVTNEHLAAAMTALAAMEMGGAKGETLGQTFDAMADLAQGKATITEALAAITARAETMLARYPRLDAVDANAVAGQWAFRVSDGRSFLIYGEDPNGDVRVAEVFWIGHDDGRKFRLPKSMRAGFIVKPMERDEA